MRYAQIADSGYVISDSYLTGEIELPDMIPISDDFDLTNKKYVGGKWESYTPAPPPEPQPSEMEILKEQVAELQAQNAALIEGAQIGGTV